MAAARTKYGSGSSPRVRGTYAAVSLSPRDSRFIPACAGNIALSWLVLLRLTVHPRVCGEHKLATMTEQRYLGSSPRVRGTSSAAWSVCSHLRFIPACAGNISQAFLPRLATPVHPRVCGEHSMDGGMTKPQAGSSPRVRGTSRYCAAVFRIVRFIPACAGNIATSVRYSVYSPVHPRVCGEHAWLRCNQPMINGSSPRVRGT